MDMDIDEEQKQPDDGFNVITKKDRKRGAK